MDTIISEQIDLKEFTLPELTQFVVSLGEPAFRAKQIFAWLYRPGVSTFEQMTDVSKKFRDQLSQASYISKITLHTKELSADGTVKYAFALADRQIIESVLIPDEERNTLCISSQVGCAMGCRFCLTGTMGLKRNLTPAEIVGQVIYAIEDLAASNKGEVNNLVFMGMGEPLANFDNLISALSILTADLGLNFSDRKITVSTCGLVPKIAELGKHSTVNLAISLHAADDLTRNQIMPVNQTYPLADLIGACRRYPLPKRRRIMIEYILLKDVNDSSQQARNLIKLLHGLPCKINLLPFNQCPALPYQKPSQATIDSFQNILKKGGHTVLVRESRGADISAACGQLANQHSKHMMEIQASIGAALP